MRKEIRNAIPCTDIICRFMLIDNDSTYAFDTVLELLCFDVWEKVGVGWQPVDIEIRESNNHFDRSEVRVFFKSVPVFNVVTKRCYSLSFWDDELIARNNAKKL